MATLKKRCDQCGTNNELDRFECQECWSDLTTAKVVNLEDLAPAPSPATDSVQKISTVLYLNFPPQYGGCFQLNSEQNYLGIGRDPEFSQVASKCEGLLKIGKRHAEIKLVDGEFLLYDLESKNGTFVDEHPVFPGTPVVLTNGNVVRFSSALVVSVVLQDK